jgi:hypothetical protein
MLFNRGRGAELSTARFRSKGGAKPTKEADRRDLSKKASKNGAPNKRQHKGGEGNNNNGEDVGADKITDSESHNNGGDGNDGDDSDSSSDGSGKAYSKEEFHSLVSAELVRQLMELAPLAMGKRASKSFPYKLWGSFAFENRLRMKGWPIDDVAAYPGDRNFKLSELVLREWRALFNTVVVSGRLCIERWSAGTYFF